LIGQLGWNVVGGVGGWNKKRVEGEGGEEVRGDTGMGGGVGGGGEGC